MDLIQTFDDFDFILFCNKCAVDNKIYSNMKPPYKCIKCNEILNEDLKEVTCVTQPKKKSGSNLINSTAAERILEADRG